MVRIINRIIVYLLIIRFRDPTRVHQTSSDSEEYGKNGEKTLNTKNDIIKSIKSKFKHGTALRSLLSYLVKNNVLSISLEIELVSPPSAKTKAIQKQEPGSSSSQSKQANETDHKPYQLRNRSEPAKKKHKHTYRLRRKKRN